MKKSNDYKELQLLRIKVEDYPVKPSGQILETFENKYPENNFLVEFCQEGEFTSLCPVTGQPDFADIVVRYIPDEKLIEAKSLKVYLMSYRSQEEFGEFITNRIMEDLWNACKPKWIEVIGKFKPRGGISWTTSVSRGSKGGN